MAYYVGDVPAEDIVIEPLRAGALIDLELFDEVEVVLRDFDGAIVSPASFYGYIDPAGTVVVEWPDVSVLTEEGLYSLTVTLLSTAGQREHLPLVYIVAQENGDWATLDGIRAEWADAPEDDYRLYTLLALARQQVEEYGTTLIGPAAVLARRAAQVMQTQNLWNAGSANPATGDLGEGTFALTVFPLDWHVKNILRPKAGVLRIG